MTAIGCSSSIVRLSAVATAAVIGACASTLTVVSRQSDGQLATSSSGVTVFDETVASPVTDAGAVYFLSAGALSPTTDTNAVIDVYKWDGTQTSPVSVAGVAPMANVFGNARSFGLTREATQGVERRPRKDLTGPVSIFEWQLSDLSVEELPQDAAVDVDPVATSADGRFAVFADAVSRVSGIDTGGVTQIWLEDTAEQTTELLSASPAGAPANVDCHAPAICLSGRYVTFSSGATNLTADAHTGAVVHVFLCDRGTAFGNRAPRALSRLLTWPGDTPATVALGGYDADGDSLRFTVAGLPANAELYDGPETESGSRIDAVPHTLTDANGRITMLPADGFVGTADLAFQVTDGTSVSETAIVSITFGSAEHGIVARITVPADAEGPSGNAAPDGTPGRLAISAAGDRVVFTSAASNLVAGDTNQTSDVYSWSRYPRTIAPVSDPAAAPRLGSDDAALSPDGRFVVFRSLAALTADDTNVYADIYLTDLEDGETVLVSHPPCKGPASGNSRSPDINSGGQFVVFSSAADNLSPVATGGAEQVYLWTRATGHLALISRSSGEPAADAPCLNPRISADGDTVVFESAATNLDGDTGGHRSLFVYHRLAQSLSRITVAVDGGNANGDSVRPAISSAGRYVAFESTATNLVSGDTPGFRDIFLCDLRTGAIERLSVGVDGVGADSDCFWASISGNGQAVYFRSRARNLVATATEGTMSGFVVDRVRDSDDPTRIRLVSHAVSPLSAGDGETWNGSLSTTGRYVAFASDATNLTDNDTNEVRDIFVSDFGEQPNHPPSAVDYAVQGDADQTLVIELVADDPDNDDLVFRITRQPAHGLLGPLDTSQTSSHPSPTVIYAPEAGFSGLDAFAFSADDGASLAEVNVSITVNPVDRPPELALTAGWVALPEGTSQGTVSQSMFAISDPDEPSAPIPDDVDIVLLSEPANGVLRDAADLVLHVGGHVPLSGLHLTYEPGDPNAFSVEWLSFQAVSGDWTSAPVELAMVVGAMLQDVHLETGWNLVSFAMDPFNHVPTVLFPTHGASHVMGPVWEWDAPRQAYREAKQLLAGIGYWLYLSGEPILLTDVEGCPVPVTTATAQAGWNSIGPVGPGTTTPVPSTEPGTWGCAWEWQPASQAYTLVGEMSVGLGYWLYAPTEVAIDLGTQ